MLAWAKGSYGGVYSNLTIFRDYMIIQNETQIHIQRKTVNINVTVQVHIQVEESVNVTRVVPVEAYVSLSGYVQENV